MKFCEGFALTKLFNPRELPSYQAKVRTSFTMAKSRQKTCTVTAASVYISVTTQTQKCSVKTWQQLLSEDFYSTSTVNSVCCTNLAGKSLGVN